MARVPELAALAKEQAASFGGIDLVQIALSTGLGSTIECCT
jgi:hypothetical protein